MTSSGNYAGNMNIGYFQKRWGELKRSCHFQTINIQDGGELTNHWNIFVINIDIYIKWNVIGRQKLKFGDLRGSKKHDCQPTVISKTEQKT